MADLAEMACNQDNALEGFTLRVKLEKVVKACL
jgi:hypothetical protein